MTQVSKEKALIVYKKHSNRNTCTFTYQVKKHNPDLGKETDHNAKGRPVTYDIKKVKDFAKSIAK